MRLILTVLFLLGITDVLVGQKMLLIEKANRAKTTKLYIGDELHYRLRGEENYWYSRTITDMLPESKTLLLDNFAVRVDSISVIKVRRKPIWRILGGAFFSFGATLTLATTAGRFFYNDKDVEILPLYTTAAASLGAGWYLNTPRKLRLGKKFRLRAIEIKFPDPWVPVPPENKQ